MGVFTVVKLYKWYQIALSITFTCSKLKFEIKELCVASGQSKTLERRR